MTNPQPALDTASRPRCPHDGRLLQRDRICWFCGRKAEEQEESMAAKTKTVPEVESEISPGVARAVDDMARVVRDGGLESLSLQVGGTEPLVIDRETAERIGRNVAALQRRSVDTETGEVGGQMLLGIECPTVEVQRRAHRLMTPREFNGQTFALEEGDKLSVKGVDVAGTLMYEVKLTKSWEVDHE